MRNYVSRFQSELHIYTGTLGQLTYKNKPLFLTQDDHGKPVIRVPEFFWKIVQSPSLNQAIVFIGLNNPAATHATQICPDICVSAHWSFPSRQDATKGFLYCCSYQDFKRVVTWAPNLSSGCRVLQNVLV